MPRRHRGGPRRHRDADRPARGVVRQVQVKYLLDTHAEQLGRTFPPDPADCLIAATARVHDLTLITSDAAIRKCGAVRTLW
ncbi:MAG: hypothetical protein DMF97_02950 [Acidobacteria bacterium]|nr:MAG: hypothetical protein DMF97_02950 [Acidobacteriota bacterium]